MVSILSLLLVAGGSWETLSTEPLILAKFSETTFQIQARARVTRPTTAVIQLLSRPLSHPGKMPYVTSVEQLAPGVYLTTYSAPFVEPRDCVTRVTTRAGLTHRDPWLQYWVSEPGSAPVRPGVVRVVINSGYWRVSGGDEAEVEYFFESEYPPVPGWLRRDAVRRGVTEVLDAVGGSK